jgi:hypothetical protein
MTDRRPLRAAAANGDSPDAQQPGTSIPGCAQLLTTHMVTPNPSGCDLDVEDPSGATSQA